MRTHAGDGAGERGETRLDDKQRGTTLKRESSGGLAAVMQDAHGDECMVVAARVFGGSEADYRKFIERAPGGPQ